MKLILSFFSILLLVVSTGCNKDFQLSKDLDGIWEIEKIITYKDDANTTTITEGLGSLEFKKCNEKKDETCEFTYTNSDGEIYQHTYAVDNFDDIIGEVFINANNETESNSSDDFSGNWRIQTLEDDDLMIEMASGNLMRYYDADKIEVFANIK